MVEQQEIVRRWAITCDTCDEKTVGEVKFLHYFHGKFDHEDQRIIDIPCTYYVVVCESCGDVQFHSALDIDDDEPPVRVWPPTRQLAWTVPDDVRADWREAVVCYEARAYAATVVMVRRMLEGVCREKGVAATNLNRMLDRMRADGHIDGSLAEWGHMLREVGNTGAHHGGRVSRESATDALDFAEAFATHVFVLREKYNEYLARRDGKDAAGGKPTGQAVPS
jgi:hypothetical protein